MIIFREHPKFFLGLKCTQLLFTILVMTFEITQYVVYGKNYVSPGQHNDWFDKAQDEGDSNGEPKLWLLVVCTLTISSLVFNLIFFKRCWEKGSCLWTEILFSALWLSAGLSNLDPVYRGTNHLNCRSPSLRGMPTMQFICDMWVTSLIFGWFILGTFMLTTFMSWQISKERRQKIHWVGRSSLSNPSSFDNNKLHRKSLVLPYLSPIPQPIVTVKTEDPASDELEKGGVPELLLQSGLPADKRMSLKIVLPQSSPLGQGLDLSVSDDDDSPTQDNNPSNNGLNFSPPPVNGSTLTLPDVVQPEPSNPNLLVIPSKKSTEVSSLHEVPL